MVDRVNYAVTEDSERNGVTVTAAGFKALELRLVSHCALLCSHLVCE